MPELNPYEPPDPIVALAAAQHAPNNFKTWLADRAALLASGCLTFFVLWCPATAIYAAVDTGWGPAAVLGLMTLLWYGTAIPVRYSRGKSILPTLATGVATVIAAILLNQWLLWIGTALFASFHLLWFIAALLMATNIRVLRNL